MLRSCFCRCDGACTEGSLHGLTTSRKASVQLPSPQSPQRKDSKWGSCLGDGDGRDEDVDASEESPLFSPLSPWIKGKVRDRNRRRDPAKGKGMSKEIDPEKKTKPEEGSKRRFMKGLTLNFIPYRCLRGRFRPLDDLTRFSPQCP